VLWVGGHQSLLHREDEVVRGMQRGRGHLWIGAPQANVEGSDRLAQSLRYFGLVFEPEPLDIVEQGVRLCHQRPPPLLRGLVVSFRNGGGSHLQQHHNRDQKFVKYRFTSRQLLQRAERSLQAGLVRPMVRIKVAAKRCMFD